MPHPLPDSPFARADHHRALARPVLVARALCAFVLAGVAAPVGAQVSLIALDAAYTQSFDALPASGSAQWSNNATLPGWYHARTGTGTSVVADTGTSNGGNLYSYGATGSSDRALGSIGSSNATAGNFFWGVRLANNTGATITSLDVTYTGEQWRNSAAAAQTVAFSYLVGSPGVTGSLAEFQSAGVAVAALDFTSPITGGSAGALNGNLPANQQAHTVTISGLTVPNGSEVMLRWSDPDNTGADHGLAIDDVSITPHGEATGTPGLSIADVSQNEGDSGTTTFTFTVSLPAPAPAGGVTFDIATSNGTATAPSDYTSLALVAQTIPAGATSATFDVLVNGDTTTEGNETFFVTLSNASGATIVRGQATGTIVNDDVSLAKIHDVQGNGATTPMPGATVTVEGVVIANFLGSGKLSGFFLEEEDADADADPATSEGIFVFCGLCTPTAVAEGQRVRVTGVVSEFQGMTELTPTSASTVVVTDAGNHMAEVTPSPITLPISGDVDAFYEAREAMLVTYADTLTVSEYFELFRFGQIELVQGERPRTFTEDNAPSVAGYAAHLDALARRQVILDDDNNAQEAPLLQPDGSQAVYYPHANGGFSVGTQGTDFFRGGDQVEHLTGVLHWSWAGFGDNTWRIRPSQSYPVTFTVANPRPVAPPDVGGAIRVVGMNLLNYFTTIDTTSSSSSGPCGPSGGQDCRGADSTAELARQRERASIVVCTLNPDVAAFMELENTTPTASITDLLGAVNARCGNANPYVYVDTGGTLGTDAIRVAIVYRQGIVTPIGSVLTDMNPIHNRPPTAQTFQVAGGSASGNRFTVVANHFKSKGSCPTGGSDADQNDGQSCWAATRTAQAQALLTWVDGTVIPAAGSPDVLLLGDFNSYAHETPVTTLESGGYLDMETELHGTNAYSYLFSGELGHLDYAFASTSLAGKVTGADAWHINADEADLFDYNDEVRDVGESTFEEKPDGSALTPPRVVFQPATPYRASDHDPVLVGLYSTATVADVAAAITAAPNPVTAGSTLAYTVTLTNNGPNAADAATWTDTLPTGTRFVSLVGAAGWTCTTPAVGAAGTVACSAATFATGSAAFTLTVAVDANVAHATALSNTVTAASATTDTNPANNSATATSDIVTSADVGVTISDSPDPVTAGSGVTYTITLSNAGPSDAASVTLNDTLPAGTTFADLAVSSPDLDCTAPAIGAVGTVACTATTLAPGSSVLITFTVEVDASVVAGTVLSNTVTAATTGTSDPNPANGSATATTTVQAAPEGHLAIAPTAVDFGDQLVGTTSAAATITLTNDGSAVLQITALTPPDAPFARSGGSCAATLPITLAAGAQCTLAYTFTPTMPAVSEQTLSVVADAPGSGTIALRGNGVLPASADIALTIDDDRDVVQVGDTLDYVITVSNPKGTATASVTVSDVLPAELSDGAWTCVPTGAATCAGGSGDRLSDVATLPPGTQVSYVYSATVLAAGANDTLVNSASATSATSDPNPGNNAATDTDTVVIFKDGFDDAGVTTPVAVFGDGYSAATLSIDAALLARLGIMPTAIATGETAAGEHAFTLDVARFGTQLVARLRVRGVPSHAAGAEWQPLIASDALDLAWQSAGADAASGYAALYSANAPVIVVKHDAKTHVTQLRIAVRDGVRALNASAK